MLKRFMEGEFATPTELVVEIVALVLSIGIVVYLVSLLVDRSFSEEEEE